MALIPHEEYGRLNYIKEKKKEIKVLKPLQADEEIEDQGQERLSSRRMLMKKSNFKEECTSQTSIKRVRENCKKHTDLPTRLYTAPLQVRS